MQSFRQKYNALVRWLVPGIAILFSGAYLWRALLPDYSRPDLSTFLKHKEWTEYPANPILPDEEHSRKTGTVFDFVLWQENMTSTGIPSDLYFRGSEAEPVGTALTWRIWNSWRQSHGIAYSTSRDGKTWNQNLTTSLGRQDTEWENQVNRPFVKKVAIGKYAMWYTGQKIEVGIGGRIGYAESPDGITFYRSETMPVLVPTLPWELEAVTTPTVIDLPNGILRMYYAAGETYEPDAIGVAHSYDGGLTWVKHGDPIFKPDRKTGELGTWWDSYKVNSPHVIRGDDDYFYMFYTGFTDLDHSAVGVARSKDGLTGWERHIGNPIVRAREGAWNCNAVSKPFVGWSGAQQEWLLWHNGRCGSLERIGLSTLKSKSFGRFVNR